MKENPGFLLKKLRCFSFLSFSAVIEEFYWTDFVHFWCFEQVLMWTSKFLVFLCDNAIVTDRCGIVADCSAISGKVLISNIDPEITQILEIRFSSITVGLGQAHPLFSWSWVQCGNTAKLLHVAWVLSSIATEKWHWQHRSIFNLGTINSGACETMYHNWPIGLPY